jgi:CRISPR-associated protein Csc2
MQVQHSENKEVNEMSVIGRYDNEMLESYTNDPQGHYVSLLLVRRIESEAIFRTEGSGEAQNKEFVHAGLKDQSLIRRVVISKRKQTAAERRTGRELLRRHELLYEGEGGRGLCALNTNNPCGECIDCMLYGYAVGGGGAQKSRVITDDAFSLHPASVVTDVRTFNAPFEDGTPWDREREQRMTGLGGDEYVKPEAVFMEIETLKDVTADELRYVLGNVLRTNRYGAISSRIGKVKNLLVGLAFSDCELFSNLELTQAVYDRLQGDADELEFPLETKAVVAAAQEAAQVLSQRVVGRVTWMSEDDVAALVDELIALYSDDREIKAMLERISY